MEDRQEIGIPGPAATRQIDRRLVAGVAWTAGGKWASQLISWAATLVIARLLSPADFGLINMANIYVGLVAMTIEFGMGTAIVMLRELTAHQIEQINTLSVMLGLLGMLISAALAWPLAAFWGAPELAPLILVLSTVFLIGSVRVVPAALYEREMGFRELSVLETVQSFVQSAATLALALAGAGYWALAWGHLAGYLAASVLVAVLRPCRFARPRRAAVAPVLRFSWHVLGARLSWYGFTNADFFVAGKMLGAAPLGAYQMARDFATAPILKVTTLVYRVTPSLFSAVKSDLAVIHRYLLSISEVMAMIGCPAAFGLSVVGEEFVRVALGEKWLEAAVPLQLLAVYAAFRSVAGLFPQVLMARDEARFVMWNSFGSFAALSAGFVIGSRWGTAGIAMAWIVIYPWFFFNLLFKMLSVIDLPARRYFSAVGPSIFGSLVMAGGVWAIKPLLAHFSFSVAARLGIEVLAGAVLYGAFLAVAVPGRLRDCVNFARGLGEAR